MKRTRHSTPIVSRTPALGGGPFDLSSPERRRRLVEPCSACRPPNAAAWWRPVRRIVPRMSPFGEGPFDLSLDLQKARCEWHEILRDRTELSVLCVPDRFQYGKGCCVARCCADYARNLRMFRQLPLLASRCYADDVSALSFVTKIWR